MKTASKNIIPIVQKLSIFHHIQYGYMFVDLIKKAEYFNLFGEVDNKIPWKDVMIFTTNEQFDIQDLSKNVFPFLKLTNEED